MTTKESTGQFELHGKQVDVLLVLPVLPGQAEAWRRFVQELQGPQRQEWMAWRKRSGLRSVRLWIQHSHPTSALLIEAKVVQQPLVQRTLIDEKEPFDRWLREQIFALHALDLSRFHTGVRWELVPDVLEHS